MKKKFLIGATVLLIVITTVISLITTSRGADNWYIEKDEAQGISWYYEVVDGEAVNVRIVDYDDSQTTITVPSEFTLP